MEKPRGSCVCLEVGEGRCHVKVFAVSAGMEGQLGVKAERGGGLQRPAWQIRKDRRCIRVDEKGQKMGEKQERRGEGFIG